MLPTDSRRSRPAITSSGSKTAKGSSPTSIRVDSTEGQGASFRIILPADTSKIIDPSETATSRPSAADLERGL